MLCTVPAHLGAPGDSWMNVAHSVCNPGKRTAQSIDSYRARAVLHSEATFITPFPTWSIFSRLGALCAPGLSIAVARYRARFPDLNGVLQESNR